LISPRLNFQLLIDDKPPLSGGGFFICYVKLQKYFCNFIEGMVVTIPLKSLQYLFLLKFHHITDIICAL
jgi:hypothetical protein